MEREGEGERERERDFIIISLTNYCFQRLRTFKNAWLPQHNY
jgi:hypothetical protein